MVKFRWARLVGQDQGQGQDDPPLQCTGSVRWSDGQDGNVVKLLNG